MSVVVAFFKLKAVRWTLLSLGVALALAIGALYGVSEWKLTTTYEPPAIALRSQAPASAERGERLATAVGCVACHGTHGRILFEAPLVARLVTADLARVQSKYSDAELVTLLRTGIKRDRTSAIQMPTIALSALADSDIADIIAWLRALKPEAQTEQARTSIGPIGRVMMFTGVVHLSADMPRDPAPPVAAPADPVAHGEYLVKVACSDCHRLDVPHNVKPGVDAPALREMVQAYDLPAFTHLMRDGKGAGERELKIMSGVARSALSHFTDEEIAAIHTYLSASSGSAK